MSAFGPWSACSVRCGTGTMTRSRTCIQGGPCSTGCTGRLSETRSCGTPIGKNKNNENYDKINLRTYITLYENNHR